MTPTFRRITWLAATLLSSVLTLAQDGLVCRKPGINGFDEQARRAHRFLPSNTSFDSKIVIYVENTSRGFYFHSNYVTPGYENPTKIASRHIDNLQQAYLNIRFSERPDPLERERAAEAYRDNVQVVLDKSMFSEGGYPLLDIGDVHHVAVVDGENGTLLANRSVERLDRTEPPPILLSKVLGCCLYGIPPHLAERYHQALAEQTFDRSRIKFLSLVKDSGTEAAIKNSATLRSVRLSESGAPVHTLSQIETSFAAARGTTVILLSHVEGSNFVIRDAKQDLISSIPVGSVRALASKYNIQLVDLGCETAKHLEIETLGLGVTTKFNTVKAVQALERAASAASNYADFFQALTSENLKIVVDHGFMQGWPLCGDVYAKSIGNPVWVKLARIFVSFRDYKQRAIASSRLPEPPYNLGFGRLKLPDPNRLQISPLDEFKGANLPKVADFK